MFLLINGHTYQMGDKQIKSVFDAARFAMKGKFAIYALEKQNIIECRKDIFKTKKRIAT